MDVSKLRTYFVLALECKVSVLNAILWHLPLINMHSIVSTMLCHLEGALRTWISSTTANEETSWLQGSKRIIFRNWENAPRLRVQHIDQDNYRLNEFEVVRLCKGVTIRRADGLPLVRLLSGAFQQQLYSAIDNFISYIDSR
jgi:hypothetical protein